MAVGAGAESRNQIGLVIVGGLVLGTLLTLFVIPTVYTLLARDRSRAAGQSPEQGTLFPSASRGVGRCKGDAVVLPQGTHVVSGASCSPRGAKTTVFGAGSSAGRSPRAVA